VEASEGLLFASEIKAILEWKGLDRGLDLKRLRKQNDFPYIYSL